MRIAMPVDENKGMDSQICEHFGQTPFWAVYDTDKKELEIKPKVSEHGHGGCIAIDEVMQYRPGIIFVRGMGWNAIRRCADEKITVKTGPFNDVKAVVDNLDRLEDMTQGCK